MVYTDLKRGESGSFLTKDEPRYGKSLNRYAHEAEMLRFGEVDLAKGFLDRIRADGEKGVILLEGAEES